MTHVYFMPGLAASPRIFERIKLSQSTFTTHFLKWKMPSKKESLYDYSKRMCEDVNHDSIILIGVSFGGILIQEMTRFLKVKKLIIISSVKSPEELPARMRFTGRTGLYKILPTAVVQYIPGLTDRFNAIAPKRMKLYRTYMSVNSPRYLNWAIKNLLLWKGIELEVPLVHIHGDCDPVFPHRNIKDCITIKNGTHIMILQRFKWFNDNLPKILLA